MRSILSIHARGRGKSARHARASLQLLVEQLEDRCVPSTLQGIQVLHTLGTANPSPTPGFSINDFEPDSININGDVAYGSDLGTANDPNTFYGEGIFLQKSGGQAKPLAYAGAPAPGTNTTYGPAFLGPISLNDHGDVAFNIFLNPPGSPNGVNAGAFRYSDATQTVTPVVIPGVTKVPGGGGTFAGMESFADINNSGDIVLSAIVPTTKGVPGSTTGSGQQVGVGVYESNASGKLTALVTPGDQAPGGGKFDYAGDATMNDSGSVAFDGHLAGEPYQLPFFPPQSAFIFPYKSVYVRNGSTGAVTSVAHIGAAAPGGGTFSQCLFPAINNNGDVLFTGVLSGPSDPDQVGAVFLYKAATGTVIPIARPGDPMPGGGTLVSTSLFGSIFDLNNSGTVIFSCVLSTDVDANGTKDTGEFEWSNGQVSLIARTGTQIPGVGKIQDLFPPAFASFPPPPSQYPLGGVINDRGQILFNALFQDGSDRLMIFTPKASSTSSTSSFFVLPAATTNTSSSNNIVAAPASGGGQAGGTGDAGHSGTAGGTQTTAGQKSSSGKPSSTSDIDAVFASWLDLDI